MNYCFTNLLDLLRLSDIAERDVLTSVGDCRLRGNDQRCLIFSVMVSDFQMGQYDRCTATEKNIPSEMCAQRRLKSVCASAQTDLSLRCALEETLHPWLSKRCPMKILIRMHNCAGLPESLLDAHVRRFPVSCLRGLTLPNDDSVESNIG